MTVSLTARRLRNLGPRATLAPDESSYILLALSLSITIDAPTRGRGGVQQNDRTLVNG